MRKKVVLVSTLILFLLLGMSYLNHYSVASAIDDFSQTINSIQEEQAFKQLGEALKTKLTPDNSKVILIKVNSEPVNLNEWNYQLTARVGRARNFDLEMPSPHDVLNMVIISKAVVSEAKQKGIYPSESAIDQYVAEQARILNEEKPESYLQLVKATGLSQNEFFEIMKVIWADSLAKQKYSQHFLESIARSENESEKEYMNRAEKLYNEHVSYLVANSDIEYSERGKELLPVLDQ